MSGQRGDVALVGAALCALLTVGPGMVGSTSQGRSQTAPPEVPRDFAVEIQQADMRVRDLARTVAGDPARYVLQAQPYGPLSLDVGVPLPPDLVNECAASFAGGVAFHTNIMPQMRTLNDRVRCGESCYAAEIRSVVADRAAKFQALVKQFRALEPVRVVALWPEGYRVGDFAVVGGDTYELLRSPRLQALPWETRKSAKPLAALLGERRVSPPAADAVVAALRAFQWRAIVADPDGNVRAILPGSFDQHQVGFVFASSAERRPTVGTRQREGGAYTYVKEIAPLVYFYTSF